MKTKLIAFILGLSMLAQAQITNVDLTTVHTIGSGATITGDPLFTAFTKLNASVAWLNNFCATNATTNAVLMAEIPVIQTNILNLSSVLYSNITLFPLFTNWFYPDYTYTKTNLNAEVGGVTAEVLTISNLLNTAPASTILAGTMDFDSGAIRSDGSGNITAFSLIATNYTGGLIDGANSSGTSGYFPAANGTGGWFWISPDVIPDSGGLGGTTLHLKASDTGGDMYIHVTSIGVTTATSSP